VVRLTLAVLFALIYAGLMVRGAVIGNFDGLQQATPVTLIAATYLWGGKALESLRGRKDQTGGG
jgi:hypothetical protein